MARIRISGRSDDLILVEGDVFGEWPTRYDRPAYIAAGDGSIIKAHFDDQGVWRLTLEHKGSASWAHEAAGPEDSPTAGSDTIILEGDIRWVGVAVDAKTVP